MWPRYEGLRTMEMGTQGAFRDALNSLVLAGEKRVTLAQEDDYRREGEEPDFVGERLALLGSDGVPVAFLQTTRVDVLRFGDLRGEAGDELAEAAGEGHRDGAHLHDGYRRWWSEQDTPVTDDTTIYAVWFSVVDHEPVHA